MSYSVVWFKRDLRTHDHAPLKQALQSGPVLCLYCIEPTLWAQPDASAQHYHFALECLRDLWVQLKELGLRLQLVAGDAPEVLAKLHAEAPFVAVYSHEETGNEASYARDRAVSRWCKAQGVDWHQYKQFGVVRGVVNRDVWHLQWTEHMSGVQVSLDGSLQAISIGLPWDASKPPVAVSLGLKGPDKPQRQVGGRARAKQVLQSFLTDRSARYRGGISSPLSASEACSRLSPYLALGCLSVREVVQAVQEMQGPKGEGRKRHQAGLRSFTSRLHWHCHFIQKLESEPDIEFRNMHRGYDGLREAEHNPEHLKVLMAGRTGWPLVDACIAMLRETGWVNFRMRAMIVSIAAYPLWLHWRPVGEWLAREFLDYEPGIHWSQLQMQSGTTGINIPRIYNPIKQARDQDPDGQFVRRWLPAMRKVPDAWLFEPWRMPLDMQSRLGLTVDGPEPDIPQPLVDLEPATRAAKKRLFELRAQPSVRAAKAGIVHKHGSRTFRSSRGADKRSASDHAQLELL